MPVAENLNCFLVLKCPEKQCVHSILELHKSGENIDRIDVNAVHL